VLRFLERVRYKVGTHNAEAQVEAFAEQATHLFVHADSAWYDWQVSRRRQLHDAARDEHARLRSAQHVLERAVNVRAQTGEIGRPTLEAEQCVVRLKCGWHFIDF